MRFKGLNVNETKLREKYFDKYFINDEESFQLFLHALRLFNKELRNIKNESTKEYNSEEFNQMIFCLFKEAFIDFYRNIDIEAIPVITNIMDMYIHFEFGRINKFRMELERNIIKAIEENNNNFKFDFNYTNEFYGKDIIANAIDIINKFNSIDIASRFDAIDIESFNYERNQTKENISFTWKNKEGA